MLQPRRSPRASSSSYHITGVEDPGVIVTTVDHAIVVAVGTQRIGAREVHLLAVGPSPSVCGAVEFVRLTWSS